MRESIQTKLNEISTVESGPLVPDDIVENGITYFGYSLQESYQSSDMDKNSTNRVSIIGFVVRKENSTENTLSIVDSESSKIVEKLKELNFKCSKDDIDLSDGIRKKKITGYAYYNEINNNLVV